MSTAVREDQPRSAADAWLPWPQGWTFRLLLVRWRCPVWTVGLLVFGWYWIIPLLLAAVQHDLTTIGRVETWAAGLSAFPQLQQFVLRLGHEFGMPSGMAYLEDRSHLMFALLLAPGGAVATLVLRSFAPVVGYLQQEGLTAADQGFVADVYRRHHELANHWAGRLLSFALAGLAFIVFFHFHRDAGFAYWWGSSQHGPAGLVFAGLEFGMVYFGTQAMIQIAFGSLMLTRLFSHGITLRPFHPDGCSGMSPVGRLIFALWIFVVCLGGEIIVTLFSGYLGIEKLQISWMLALLAACCLPIAAFLPLIGAARAVYRARTAELQNLEQSLMILYGRARQAAADGKAAEAAEWADHVNKLRESFQFLMDINIWPFNPRALAFVIAIYFAQIALTLHEVLGKW
ncbi:MAG TPA: hypothetical protein VLW52_10880 [Opitutaceae bacterium]|nr:hypothetical protein [Opitutaceae bacterium]